ncbi:MAG: F0F1 ATP synthase subunit B [Alphaproteobacteria bacterium]|nr:F0F1 ATP synthase subunit B [Alphaproteobacteria bacterium]
MANEAIAVDVAQADAPDGAAANAHGAVTDPLAADAAELHTSTEAHGGEEHGGAFPPFDPATFGSQLLWLAITFAALYFLMSRVALPRIGEILEVRRDRIEGDLAEADRLRQKTDQAMADYEAALNQARNKAHGIAEATRGEIRHETESSRAAVEADLAERVAAAEQSIQATKTEALKNVDEIAAQTAQAVVAAIAGKVSIADARAAVAEVVKG